MKTIPLVTISILAGAAVGYFVFTHIRRFREIENEIENYEHGYLAGYNDAKVLR